MKFNPDDRQQQVLLPEMDIILDEQAKIQERIREIIEEDGEIQYITILYKKQGYKLLGVRAVKMSQYAETIANKDLSDYIAVDYEDVYEDVNNSREEIPAELEFNFKSEILAKSENLDVEIDNKDIKRGENNE